jgi:PAS domain S-box-containing protein
VTQPTLVELVERQLEVASLSGEVDAVMRGIVERLLELPDADGASLSSIDAEFAYFHVSVGMDAPLQGRTIPLRETLGAVCAESGEVEVMRADDGGEVWNGLTAGAAAIVLAPIAYDGELRGILGVRSAQPDAFSPVDVETCSLLARSAAIALRNAELVDRLARSEQEYRQLHDQASDAILVTDAHGGLLDANEVAAGLLGYSIDELRAMHSRDLFAPEELEAFPPRQEELQASRELRGERPFRRKDGAVIAVEYASRVLDDGRVHTAMRDVTQRKAHEERLQSTVGRLQAIVQTQQEISKLELDPDEVTSAIVERAQRLAGADGAAVQSFDGNESVFMFASGTAHEQVGLRLNQDSSLAGVAGRLGETVYAPDTTTDPRVDAAACRLVGARSLICAPLRRGGKAVGVLSVMARLPDAFDELALESTRAMAEFVSTVMRNADELASREQLVERLRTQGQVVEHMQTALWVWQREADGQFRIDYANAASYPATGIPPEEIIGQTLDDGLPAHRGLDETFLKVLESNEPVDLGEVEYGDARIRPGVFTLKAFPLADNRVAVTFENVTDGVRARRALQESEARFRGAFHSSSTGMALNALDGRFVQVNDRLAELLGYTPHELVRLNAAEVVHPEELHLDRALGRELRNGERNAYLREARLVRKDGGDVWARIGVSLVRDYEGAPVHFVTHVEDVTERRALEHQLRQAQKMEAVGRLAGGIAHDFNNLLTAIAGYSEFLIGGLEDERLRQHAEEIKRAAARAAALTGQLLAFSRRQVLQPRVLDLNTVVSDMDMMLRRLIGEDVELVTRLEPQLHAVRADPTQVEQVIVNLVVNARDAMPGGGALTIETANDETDHGSFVELTLTDTGLGMTDEQRQWLFDPFFTTKEGGTGLGLATVYGIVEQSGGTIEVDSAPGLGTSFRIRLPRADEPPEPVLSDAVTVAPGPGTETVLLVEDETVVRQLVAEILTARGYTVLQAGDGPSALEVLRRHRGRVDLLLTDVVMPGMSGRDVAQSVTALRAGLRVLYMSGYTDAALPPDVLEDGVSFLQKPFSADDLARKVRTLLDG